MGLKWRTVPGHQLTLLEGGRALFPAMVAAIDQACRRVQLETYIFRFTGTPAVVAEALARAAARGVEVCVVVDGVGTPEIPGHWQQRWQQAGVQWHVYAPLGRLGLVLPSRWRRLHRKLCLVDERIGFCGGINLVDDLDDVALGRLSVARLDFALQVSGPLLQGMHATMDRLWWRLQAGAAVRHQRLGEAWHTVRDHWRSEPECSPPRRGPGAASTAAQPDQVAGLLLRDNIQHRHDIERAYLKAIGQARDSIIIANAYCIPGRRLRRALVLAVRRGVRVQLLVQGKYEHFLQFHAARPIQQRLCEQGVELYVYAPSALHAKVAVVDRRWATVGSSNLDPLSLLLAREANVLSLDVDFAQQLHQRLDELVLTAGERVDGHRLRQRQWRERVLDRLALGVMRVLLFLTGYRY